MSVKKEKFHITLITDDNKEEYNLLGEYDRSNKIINYFESNSLRSKITLELDNQRLIKENIDYTITLNFTNNAITQGSIYLKKEDKELTIDINTESIIITEDNIKIVYCIANTNKVYYELSIGG